MIKSDRSLLGYPCNGALPEGKLVGVNTVTGKAEVATEITTLVGIGRSHGMIGDTVVNVERQPLLWLKLVETPDYSLIDTTVYAVDGETVSTDGTGRSKAGTVKNLDSGTVLVDCWGDS